MVYTHTLLHQCLIRNTSDSWQDNEVLPDNPRELMEDGKWCLYHLGRFVACIYQSQDFFSSTGFIYFVHMLLLTYPCCIQIKCHILQQYGDYFSIRRYPESDLVKHLLTKKQHRTNIWYLTQNWYVGLAKLTHKINKR